MKDHVAYLRYVLRHKWYVFLACRQMCVPMHRAILHDWTKFTRREWTPYVHQFYNPDGTKSGGIRDASGAYDPNMQPMEFQLAWLSHQRNKHHWQAWVSLGDGGSLSVLPIPETYVREMIADWIGAGQAISGRKDPRPWYEENKKEIVLNPDTRIMLEALLATG